MPTPVITNNQLGWAYLSTVQSNIRPVTSFLKGLFFRGTPEFLPTESVELSYLNGDTEMAPFVEINAEAVPVSGNSVTFANVSCPNIRIKRPMEAYQVFLRRQPGTGIFINSGDQVAAARQAAIDEDQITMARKIERREEWMVSRLLTGVDSTYLKISYQVDEGANFTVSTPRPSGSVATVPTTWATSTTIKMDFHNAKIQMAKTGNMPTDVVLGSTAAANFIQNSTVLATLDNKNVNAGVQTLITQFSESGVIFLGTFMGVNVWQYVGTFVADGTGTVTPYVGDELAVFLDTDPARNAAKFYYGCIPDHDAFEQGSFVGKVFSKSWTTKDPSIRTQLTHTRPLPHIRKPGSVYVLDTVP